MATYILTKKQKDLIVEVLKTSYIEAHNKGWDVEEVDNLINYIENPYSGSWMGKSNTR